MQEQVLKKRASKVLPLLILFGVFIVTQNWGRISLAISPIDSHAVRSGDVVLYSTSWCPYCSKTRDFLNSADIPFTEYDIEKSAYAYQEYEELSGRGVPVLRIGEQTIEGHRPQAIRSAVQALSRPASL